MLTHLAVVALDSGEPERAGALLDEALASALHRQDAHATMAARQNKAVALRRAGHVIEAYALMRSFVADIAGFADAEMLVCALDEFAEVAAERGADADAARLSAAVDAFREQLGLPRRDVDHHHLEDALDPSRRRLGEVWEAERAAGRLLSHAEALELAARTVEL